MGQATFANSRGIAHKGSDDMSPILPDVRKTPTPGGAIPIPYPNIGKSGETSSGPTSVKTDDQMPMTKDAKYMITTGDEAGSAMSVMSNKIKGACEYMMYPLAVKFDGKNVCRMADPLFHSEDNGMG